MRGAKIALSSCFLIRGLKKMCLSKSRRGLNYKVTDSDRVTGTMTCVAKATAKKRPKTKGFWGGNDSKVTGKKA